MAFRVEELRVEQPEADMTLAVPKLPWHEPQQILAGREVQEPFSRLKT